MREENTPPSKPRRTRAQIQSLVRLYHQSGQTQAAFCREQAIAAGSLSKWLREERAPIEGFVPVSLPCVTDSLGARIHFPDGLELHLPSSWQASQLVDLVHGLQMRGQAC